MVLPELHRAVHDYLSADSVQKLLVVPNYETCKWKILWSQFIFSLSGSMLATVATTAVGNYMIVTAST